ncbi:MAG: MFS transporter [bacterium]|nr:MFS transporter [bacterium]
MKFRLSPSIQTVAASVLIQLCLGGIYAWSVYTPLLKDEYGLTGWQTASVFGGAIAVFALSMVAGGRLLQRWTPRRCAALGALLFGAGYALAGASGGSYAVLLLGVSGLSGAGTGFGYLSAIASCVGWYPERKGLITGVAVAGFGGGSILVAAAAEQMLTSGAGVLFVIPAVGVVSALLMGLGAWRLHPPPRRAHSSGATVSDSVIRTSAFWGMSLGMFAGTFGGLLIISNLKPIGLAAGLTSSQASHGIACFAVGNVGGRILWGAIYDRIGWLAPPVSLLTLGAGAWVMHAAPSLWIFYAAVICAGFSFGGCFVLYAAHVAALYGVDRVSGVYPKVFLSYAASGIIGPAAGGLIFDLTASYALALEISMAIAIVSGLACWGLLRPQCALASSLE